MLDLILSNNPTNINNVVVDDSFQLSDSPDHYAVYFEFNVNTKRVSKAKEYIWAYKLADIDVYSQALAQIDWSNHPIQYETNVNTILDLILNEIFRARRLAVPHILKKEKKKQKFEKYPLHIVNLIRQRKTQKNKGQCRKAKQTLLKLKKQIDKQNEEDLANYMRILRKDPLEVFKFKKRIGKRTAPFNSIYINEESGSKKLTTDPTVRKKILSDHFTKNFTERTFNPFQKWYDDKNSRDPNIEYFDDIQLHPIEVEAKFDSLEPSTTTGYSGLNKWLLKHGAASLGYPFSILYNCQLNQGIIAEKSRRALITTIEKPGKDPNSVKAARPIAVASEETKQLESLVLDRMMPFFKRKGVFNDRQFGFTRGRSRVEALLVVWDKILHNLDVHKTAELISFDFASAFDTLQHVLIAQKFHDLGVRGNIGLFIETWLTGRFQAIKIDGELSDWMPILSGVLQG